MLVHSDHVATVSYINHHGKHNSEWLFLPCVESSQVCLSMVSLSEGTESAMAVPN